MGKDAVLARMREMGLRLHYTITATTRPRREGERDGVDYYFVSQKRFQEMVEGGEFLEWANVYGNWYGVPKKQVQEALGRGLDVIIKADVQGAETIKGIAPQAVFIFLAPPSMEELEERLRQRKTESTEELSERIKTAREEMESLHMFDYVVVNHQIDQTVSQIDAIITAEGCRVKPRVIKL